MDPGLYVVATPIGNLGDISQRALDVLRGADLIAAEDTRHSQRLLQHFGIEGVVIAYHEHSDGRVQERITQTLEGGGSVALAESIRDWFPNQAVAEHPAFANARGMLKYLRFVCEVPV